MQGACSQSAISMSMAWHGIKPQQPAATHAPAYDAACSRRPLTHMAGTSHDGSARYHRTTASKPQVNLGPSIHPHELLPGPPEGVAGGVLPPAGVCCGVVSLASASTWSHSICRGRTHAHSKKSRARTASERQGATRRSTGSQEARESLARGRAGQRRDAQAPRNGITAVAASWSWHHALPPCLLGMMHGQARWLRPALCRRAMPRPSPPLPRPPSSSPHPTQPPHLQQAAADAARVALAVAARKPPAFGGGKGARLLRRGRLRVRLHNGGGGDGGRSVWQGPAEQQQDVVVGPF